MSKDCIAYAHELDENARRPARASLEYLAAFGNSRQAVFGAGSLDPKMKGLFAVANGFALRCDESNANRGCCAAFNHISPARLFFRAGETAQ